MKDKVSCGKFCNFCFQNPYFFPPKNGWISDRLSTASIKYLNWPSPLFGRFQNGCNKVVIEPRIVQFWSEIILVISNRTHAARKFDFEITRMISAQISLHSVQLPLFISQENVSKLQFFISFCTANDSKPSQRKQRRDFYLSQWHETKWNHFRISESIWWDQISRKKKKTEY